jgi:6-phosphogluconolactonase (cycloisomerase 2 family)
VIAASAAHHRVYVANRGNDTIATVSPAGAVTETSSGGSWPMDLALTKDALLVANRDSGNIATFELDPGTGRPARRTGDIAIARPVSMLLTASAPTN